MESIFISLLSFGLSGISAVFPVIQVFPVNLDTPLPIIPAFIINDYIINWRFVRVAALRLNPNVFSHILTFSCLPGSNHY